MFAVRVDSSEGPKDYITVLPLDTVNKRGLVPESIVGALLSSAAHENIRPDNFAANRIFVEFMHTVISSYAAKVDALKKEAKRTGNGWVYIIDKRNKKEDGSVPPENIIGAIEVRNGAVVPGSYSPNMNHQILTDEGFFILDDSLHDCLIRELMNKFK